MFIQIDLNTFVRVSDIVGIDENIYEEPVTFFALIFGKWKIIRKIRIEMRNGTEYIVNKEFEDEVLNYFRRMKLDISSENTI